MTKLANALRPITETADMGITLADGTRLSARVWMPDDAGIDPVPVILEYLPYRKRDGTCARDALTHPWFAERGYACLRVDMRGNGDSEGLMEDEYTAQELSDAVEVINWAAAQGWCNGRVGMMGISWGGFNALQVAALAPEPLRAIVTLCSTVDRYADDIHYKGGCLLNENLGWGATMWAYSSRPPDPALVGERWRGMWLERLNAEPFLPSTWLRHQTRDAYWQHGSVCEDYAAIKARVLAVGGWGDAYKNAVPQLVENVPGAKGIIGPWVHKYPHFAVPEPRIGFLQVAERWWARWLKDAPNGAEDDPDLSVYLMDAVRPQRWYTERPGRWVNLGEGNEDSLTLHLTAAGLRDMPGDGPLATVVAAPADTGSQAGEYCAIWLGPEMPGDQRVDDARSATFDTAPLAEAQDITGQAILDLTLSADAPQAQLAVRLIDVHPDGAATQITYGVLNLSHHKSHAAPAALTPGVPVRVRVPLDHTAYRVPGGHRIRVSVSNAYWPMIWPAPSSTTLTLETAQLSLPRRTGGNRDERAFPPPVAAPPWEIDVLRPENHIRRTVTDQLSGVVTLEITDDFGKTRDADHGLITGSVAREWWSIHPDDPLSARGRTHWTEENERDGWRVRTETHAEMWCDATHFHLSASLIAFEDDVEILRREFTDTIARDHL